MSAVAVLRCSALVLAAQLACGGCVREAGRTGISGVLREVTAAAGPGAWGGLLHPVDIAADARGRVYVADTGDKSIRVFDADGRALDAFGREGSGPGEFESIQDIALVGEEVVVLDSRLRRMVRFGTDGAAAGMVPNRGLEDLMAGAGPGRLILANSPQWSLPAVGREAPWPLFRVVDLRGNTIYRAGERTRTGNPFVDHIRNFVLPAATLDGRWIWIARLNDPVLELYSVETAEFVRVARRLPFEWRRLPEDFVPSRATVAEAGPPAPPFDAISLGISTDARGRAYVLTALAPSHTVEEGPAEVAVDVLAPGDTVARRYLAPRPATHIAVSSDGRRIYLLHEPTATIRVYLGENADVR